jgi:outer membrane protein TolC
VRGAREGAGLVALAAAGLLAGGCAGADEPRARVRVPVRAAPEPATRTADAAGYVRSVPSGAAAVPPSATAAPILLEQAPIDLATVLALAGEQPNAVRLARKEYLAAQAQEESAEARLFPNMSLGGNFGHHTGIQQDTAGAFFETTFQHLFLGVVGDASLDLYGGVYQFLEARQRRSASREETEAVAQATIARGAAMFFDLEREQAEIAIARDALEHAAEFRRVASARERRQVGLPVDTAQAAALVAAARQGLIAAEERFRVASAGLATLLRLDPTIMLVSAAREVRPITFVPPDARVDELIQLALRQRPDVHAAEFRVAAAQAEDEAARIGPFVPVLHAGLGTLRTLSGLSGNLGGVGVDGPNFGDLRYRADYYVALQWDLTGLGFGEVARARRAAADLDAERVRADDVRERVAREVIEAQQAVRARAAAIEAAREELEAAEEARALAEQRLGQGVGLAVDLLAADAARTNAASHVVDAIVSYNKAQYLLLARIGERPGD